MNRRYDIDWLRVFALGLLIIYHISIVFQPWAYFIYFPQSEKPIESIWLVMGLINIWRIPLLFIISGMGVYLAMRRRNWKELIKDRTKRILLPLIFGSFIIVPIHLYIYQAFMGLGSAYFPGPGHLWFLGNILIYVLLLCPIFFYLKKNKNNFLSRLFKRALKYPIALYAITIPFIIEATLLIGQEQRYESYAFTPHGFWVGLLAFFTGFFFISIGESFWNATKKLKSFALAISIPLFLIRLIYFELGGPFYLIVIESWSWLFVLFGFSSTYLNSPSKLLTYLAKAVYPIYILHMIFLFAASELILTRPIHIDKTYTIIAIEPGSPADKAMLLNGDQIITNFESWKPDIPIDINVTRKEDSFKTSIILDEKGKIGADFNLPALFIPKFKKTEITTLTTFIQFILINIITFIGCFIGYEIVKRIKDACINGRQVYWVCTLIEESEALECEAAEVTSMNLANLLPKTQVGLIHGRMRSEEKNNVMTDFKNGDIQLLVATTVIEVGVDVPNASLMIIENAERLGLAQLHQLRGRVGRGNTQSHCILLYQTPLSRDGKLRLEVMRDSCDGFYIAEKDLELRGPGQVLGTNQAGLMSFKIADMPRDALLLEDVKNISESLMQNNQEVVDPLINRWLSDREEYANV